MSGYILCQVKRAKNPYYISNISTNIYSIEELCYYLYHNIYLLDETIINEQLLVWMKEELHLRRLYQRLYVLLEEKKNIGEFILPIFKEINYLTYEELRTLNAKLSKMDAEAPVVREKKKGDALVENGMLVSAIHVYEKLLKKEGLEQGQAGLTAQIYHNLGCACSYLFQMEKAVECFWHAHQLDETEQSLITYLLAYKSIRTPIEYESRLTALNVSDQVKETVQQALERFAKKPEIPVYSQHIDECLVKFTKEYHRSTGS